MFNFPVDTVLAAAKAKHTFHQGRVAYWLSQYEATKNEYKDSGFVVDDSFGGSNVSYREVHVEFNQALQRKMTDAKSKLTEHEAKTEEYGAFVYAMSAALAVERPTTALGSRVFELPLNYDDVVYFGLGAESTAADESEESLATA